MVYDMERHKFPIDLDNIHSFVEIGQVFVRLKHTAAVCVCGCWLNLCILIRC